MINHSPSRRVRKLILQASDDSLVRKGTTLLEDALRTASMPEADAGRLFIIRTFSVGTIHGNRSPSILALLIEKRFRQFRHIAVHADHPSAPFCQAVYFYDDIEPRITLALRIIQEEKISEWFWPSAVPEWHLNMHKYEAIRALFFFITKTSSKEAAAVRMIRELYEKNAVNDFFSAIRPVDVPLIIQVFGWNQSLEKEKRIVSFPHDTNVSFGWKRILSERVRVWKKEDPRLLLAMALALTADKPSRILHPDLMYRAKVLLEKIITNNMTNGFPSNSEGEPYILPDEKMAFSGCIFEEKGEYHNHDKTTGYKEPVSGPIDKRPRGTDVINEFVSSEENALILKRTERRLDTTQLQQLQSSCSIDRDYENTEKSFTPMPGEISDEGSGKLHDSSLSPQTDIQSIEDQSNQGTFCPYQVNDNDEFLPFNHKETLLTRFAGVFFLIPVLERLGITEFIQKKPVWIEIEFANRLFLFICNKLGVPDDDCIRSVFLTSSNDVACPYEYSATEFEKALNVWFEIVCKWFRNYPALTPGEKKGMDLNGTIRRPGRMAVTKTHTDIYFNLKQVDMDIRRAGLDLNPGWVPWLGRVIQFHYTSN